MVLLLYKFVLRVDLDLSTVFTVTVLWGNLYFSNNLTLSVLLLFGVSNFLLDACNFSVLLTVSILFLLKY